MPSSMEFSLRRLLAERGLWMLIGCTLLFFSPPLLGNTFFFRDLYLLFYGKKLFLANALHHGEIPFWDPLTQGGQPFLGQPGNVAYYPFNILFLILPPLIAFNVLLVLQFLICAISAYFLARATGISETGAFVCGATYTFCGYVLSASNLMVLMQSLPWAPALIGSAHLLVRERRKRWFVLASIAGALSILGGGADMTAIAFTLAVLWMLIVPADLSMRRRVIFAASIGLMIVGLTLVSTFPALEVARNSSRQQKLPYEVFTQWSVTPQRLPELVIPRFFGPTDTLARSDYWGGRFEYGYPYIISIYFGTSVLLLAATGATLSPLLAKRCRLLLALFIVAGLTLSLGPLLPFFHWIYEHVPLIGSLRFPVKALELTLVPTALLAGAGAAALASAMRPLLVIASLVAASFVVLGIAFFASSAFRASLTQAFFGNALSPNSSSILAQSFAHVAIASALFALAVASKREFAVAAVILLDLAYAGRFVNPYAPRELFATPPLAAKVRSLLTDHGKLYRTADPYVQRLNVPTNEGVWLAWWDLQQLSRYTAATFGIPLVFHEDYDGLALVRMKRMTERVHGMLWPQRVNVLAAAGATAIITPDVIESPLVERVETLRAANGGPLFLYRNRASAPVRFATNAEIVRDDADAIGRLQSFDSNRVILPEGNVSVRGLKPAATQIRTTARTDNEWSVDVNTNAAGWLVFAETWFPGWRATVDGNERPLLRADVAFSAVAVPAGHHVVTKIYRPAAPLIGLAASIATALLLAFWRVNQ